MSCDQVMSVCRGCLATDRNMARATLYEDAFKDVTGITISSTDGLPQWLCYKCTALLKKCVRFRNKIMRSHYMLCGYMLENVPFVCNKDGFLDRTNIWHYEIPGTETEQVSNGLVCAEINDENTQGNCDERKDAHNIENGDQLISRIENESTSPLLNDKSDELSYDSSETDHDVENKCLIGSHEVASGHCEDTNTKEKVSLREVRLSANPKDEERNIKHIEIETLPPKVKNTSEINLNGKYIRERDTCYYCKKLILNFSRHMTRHHFNETDVQLALSYPKNSRERKQYFGALRKKGNFLSKQTSFKPVKKNKFYKITDYLPCSKCLGFYSKKQLWKHVKKCGNTTSTNKPQVQAQNFLLRDIQVDYNLLTNVFSRMRPDEISLIAKKDKLICMYGARYFKRHQLANVASRKMRELAKLFIEVMKLKPNINTFEEVLKPEYYDTLVKATKVIARYNKVSGQFDAPTYVMNIATSIKQCCRIALQSCKMKAINQNEIQADLKALSKIVKENWKTDVFSQVAGDFNINNYNKITIGQLAADLKLLIDYLSNISRQSFDNLTQTKEITNDEAFDKLVEATYCRALLLNRRRPGALQRLKLSDYNDQSNDSNQYKEFGENLSSTERILIDKSKIIVIRDKEKGMPILFSNEIQEDIKKMLSVRHIYVKNDNDSLFVKADGATVCGYSVLVKHAKASNVKNYRALISTRVRKHLATMTQLFTLNESEVEKLSTFIGHKLRVHEDNYNSPNDIFQTAKICKHLLLMGDEMPYKYQKALDEVKLNLAEEIIGNDIGKQAVDDFEEESLSQTVKNISEKDLSASEDIDHNISAKRRLVPWTTDQKKVVTDFFKEHIKYKKPPKRAECDELKSKYPSLLQNKDWLKIKVFIQNIYSKRLLI